MTKTGFNAEYYRRYYENRSTAVVTPPQRRAEVRFVVCRDVLRYVTDAAAARGIERLRRKCRGVLYLHVVTRDDEVDEAASDMSGHFRPARWYLRKLAAAGFVNAGMGLFVSERYSRFDPFALEVRQR